MTTAARDLQTVLLDLFLEAFDLWVEEPTPENLMMMDMRRDAYNTESEQERLF